MKKRMIIGVKQGTKLSPYGREFECDENYCRGWAHPWRFCFKCEESGNPCTAGGREECLKSKR